VSSGDVDLYLSKSWDTKPYLDPATKSVVSYLESSAHVGNIDESIFLNTAKITEMCSSDQYCYLILGVYGSKMGTLAPSPAPTISLSPRAVSSTASKLPSLTTASTTSLSISLSTIQAPTVVPVAHSAGNQRIILSSTSRSEARVPSAEVEAEVEVEAAPSRPQSRRSTSSYSSFSLLYSTLDSITDLQEASPAVGRCSSTTGRYYRYVIREPNIVSQTISFNAVLC
jgi:hypothetical protein